MRFVVTPTKPSEVDFSLEDIGELDELEDELDALLEEQGSLVLDFRLASHHHFSLKDAAVLLRERVKVRCYERSITVSVLSERACAVVSRILDEQRALPRQVLIGSIQIEILQCSIVTVQADAVANASNTSLQLGSGVSGALRRAAGPELQRALSLLAPIPEGSIVSTPAFNHRKVKMILHVPTASGSEAAVRGGYRNLLLFAAQNRLRRIAIPLLGTGTGGMTVEKGARILREECERHVQHETGQNVDQSLNLVLALIEAEAVEISAQCLGAPSSSP